MKKIFGILILSITFLLMSLTGHAQEQETTDNQLSVKRIWMEQPGIAVKQGDKVEIFIEVEAANGLKLVLVRMRSEVYSDSTTTASAFSVDEVKPGIYKATITIIDQMYSGKWIATGYSAVDKLENRIFESDIDTSQAYFYIRDVENRTPFLDVGPNDWFYDCVKYAYVTQLMKGTSATTFEAEAPVTRAQFVTLIHRLHGEPSVDYRNCFYDVADNQWYTDAVIWSSDIGIVKGFPNGIFKPNDCISREQMAVMMYRYVDYKGLLTEEKGNLEQFSDCEEISDWAESAMEWSVGAGLIQGKGNNKLDPQGTATRAESAMIFMRFIQKTIY